MSNDSPLILRPIMPSELPLLEVFLYEAIFIPPGAALPPGDIIYTPEVFIYIEDFGSKPDDICFVAQLEKMIIGAAWIRIIPAFGHIDEETPKLAISVLPEYRGKGTGSVLMHRLLEELRARGYKQTSLSVQQQNTAVRFYQRLGYKIVNQNDQEYIMVKKLN
ncbi:MAG: GNAT family N-acetyltransferase [Peptococcaceae bacterium]|nr:GNAT family N-acetyltransferase [Peptococcaceae bacterium]